MKTVVCALLAACLLPHCSPEESSSQLSPDDRKLLEAVKQARDDAGLTNREMADQILSKVKQVSLLNRAIEDRLITVDGVMTEEGLDAMLSKEDRQLWEQIQQARDEVGVTNKEMGEAAFVGTRCLLILKQAIEEGDLTEAGADGLLTSLPTLLAAATESQSKSEAYGAVIALGALKAMHDGKLDEMKKHLTRSVADFYRRSRNDPSYDGFREEVDAYAAQDPVFQRFLEGE